MPNLKPRAQASERARVVEKESERVRDKQVVAGALSE